MTISPINDDTETRAVNWLWYPYSKLMIVQSDPEEDKTAFILYFAALPIKGEVLPYGKTSEHREPVKVIYQNAEDSLEDIIKP